MNSIHSLSRVAALALCGAALVACDSIKDVATENYTDLPPPNVLLGGTVTGLGNSPLVLQNNGAANRSFSMTNQVTMGAVPLGSSYNVTVFTQPEGRTCDVANGSGTATGPVSNIQVTCVVNDGIATYNVSGTVSGGAVGTDGLQVTLTTLDGAETIDIGAGTTSFAFAMPVFDLSDYTVSATYPGAGGVTSNCSVANGTGAIVGADVTNANVNSCEFTIGGTVGFHFFNPPGPLGAGGVTLALHDAVGVELETVNVATAGAYSFLTPRESNVQARYTVAVKEHPAGQHCVLGNAGNASLVTAGNVNLAVTCGNIPPAPNVLTGTYRLDSALAYLSFFDNGTFLYGVQGEDADESGVEQGFYSLNCCGPGSLFFIVTSDGNGEAGLSDASADFGFVSATSTVKSAGPPATLSFVVGGAARNFTEVLSSTAGQLAGAWVGATSPRALVYDSVEGTAFHMGVNGVSNLQNVCLLIDNPAAASGSYVQDRNAQCRPEGVAVMDTAPRWFTGGLPGSPPIPQRASEPTSFAVTAGGVDTLSLQATYQGANVGAPVVFTRSVPN